MRHLIRLNCAWLGIDPSQLEDMFKIATEFVREYSDELEADGFEIINCWIEIAGGRG